MPDLSVQTWVIAVAVALVVLYVVLSLNLIGPTEVGLVAKRFGRKLSDGYVIAFDKEAGYQATLLMPGLRFKPFIVFNVKKFHGCRSRRTGSVW